MSLFLTVSVRTLIGNVQGCSSSTLCWKTSLGDSSGWGKVDGDGWVYLTQYNGSTSQILLVLHPCGKATWSYDVLANTSLEPVGLQGRWLFALQWDTLVDFQR